jgi:Xaa-Pro aminopeptidase
MILTVEPGLYLPDVEDVPAAYRGIGVRIEDTVLVGEDGPVPLTRGVPVQPEEVERLVGGSTER